MAPGECYLCQVPRSDKLLRAACWTYYKAHRNAGRRKLLLAEDLREAVRRPKKGDVDPATMTVEDIEEHMHWHQRYRWGPTLPTKEIERRVEGCDLSELELEVVEWVGRFGIVMGDQIDRFVLGDRQYASKGSRANALSRLLARLTYYGALDQMPLRRRTQLGLEETAHKHETAYSLGPVGTELFKEMRPDLHEGVKAKPLEEGQAHVAYHDAMVAEMVLRLIGSAQVEHQIRTRRRTYTVDLHMAPANLYGSRNLGMEVDIPSRILPGGRRRPAETVVQFGDLFLTVGVAERPSLDASGQPRRYLMPLRVEYDRGGKPRAEAVDQILTYLKIGETTAEAERWPDLAVPGYKVPLLVISEGQRSHNAGNLTPRRGWHRAANWHKHCYPEAKRQGLIDPSWDRDGNQPYPESGGFGFIERPRDVFFTTPQEIEEKGWGALVLPLFQPDPQLRVPLLQAMARSVAGTLREAPHLDDHSELRFDGNARKVTLGTGEERTIAAKAARRRKEGKTRRPTDEATAA